MTTSRMDSSMSVMTLLRSEAAVSLFSDESLGLVLDLSLALDTSSMCIFDLDIAVACVTQSSMFGAALVTTAGWGGGGGGGGGHGPGGARGGVGGVAWRLLSSAPASALRMAFLMSSSCIRDLAIMVI